MVGCSDCRVDRPDEQFMWGNTRHKTCIQCNDKRVKRREKNKKESRTQNQKTPITNVDQVDDGARAEIDYLEIGDFVEHEIRELADDAEVNEIEDIIYQTYQTNFLVHIDVAIQNMTPREVADLVIIEIESGDNYSWK